MKTVLKILDEKTGEIEDKIFWQQQKRKPKNKDWLGMKQEGLIELLMARLPSGALRVFLALAAKCEWSNVSHLPRKDLCSLADVNPSYACKALNKLVALGFIVRDFEDTNKYFLDPKCCWRGSHEDWDTAKHDYKLRLRHSNLGQLDKTI